MLSTRYDPIVRVRSNKEQDAKRAVAERRTAHQAAEDAVRSVEERMLRGPSGRQPVELLAADEIAHEHLRREKERLDERLEHARRELSSAEETLLVAHKELRIIEKVAEHTRERRRIDTERREQAALDEVAAMRAR